MLRGAFGDVAAGTIVALAVVPAAAAAVIPLWCAVVGVGELVTAFELVGTAAVLLWTASIALTVCLVALKFLMPLQASQCIQLDLRRHTPLFITWGFAVLASVALVVDVGGRFVSQTVQLDPTWAPLAYVLWLSIEVVGTLGMNATAPLPERRPPPQPVCAASAPNLGRVKQVSALSAEDLLAWLQLMLATPAGELPRGIEHEGDGKTLITSERKLARALHTPRSRVVRLLQRLEVEGKVELGRSHRDTYIHLPEPPGSRTKRTRD